LLNERIIPHPFLKDHLKFPSLYKTKNSDVNPQYPIWPENFNVTLLKLNYANSTIRWTKLFYDFKNSRTKFDFYSEYFGKDLKWGKFEQVILFINSTVWFINPVQRGTHIFNKECRIRSRQLPTISRFWLKDTKLKRKLLFRDQWAEEWEYPPGHALYPLKYYSRLNQDQNLRYPLRSTNQIEDPGDTDYVDFMVGEQYNEQFQIPSYCPR